MKWPSQLSERNPSVMSVAKCARFMSELSAAMKPREQTGMLPRHVIVGMLILCRRWAVRHGQSWAGLESDAEQIESLAQPEEQRDIKA